MARKPDEAQSGPMGQVPNDSDQASQTQGGVSHSPGEKDDGRAPDSNETFDAQYVAQLRAEAAKYRTELKSFREADAQRQAEAETAEQERLKKQQEWQTLAEKHEARLKDVQAERDGLQTQNVRLTEALTGYLDKELEQAPEYIKPLLEKLDVVDQLAYLAENREAIGGQRKSGVPASPKAEENGQLSVEERREQAYRVRL